MIWNLDSPCHNMPHLGVLKFMSPFRTGLDQQHHVFLGQAQSSSSSLPLREREDSQNETNRRRSERAIFFWRDGFKTGPLPAPFRRFDVVAMKVGWYKLWFWTKSSLYNADEEVYHDPPLIFDV